MTVRTRATEDYPYALYNATGTDYNRDAEGNLRWPSIIEMLTALVADSDQPAEDRKRAATALKFYADKIGEEIKPSGSAKRNEVERCVAGVFGRMGARMLRGDA
jgi:hypothetical protein